MHITATFCRVQGQLPKTALKQPMEICFHSVRRSRGEGRRKEQIFAAREQTHGENREVKKRRGIRESILSPREPLPK